jgi:hypothetical protein
MTRKIDPIQRGDDPSLSHGISGKNKKQKEFSLAEHAGYAELKTHK